MSPTSLTTSADRLPRWLRLWGVLTAPGAVFLLVALFWQRFPLTRATPFVGYGSFEGGPLMTLLLMPFLGLYVVWLLILTVKTGMSVRRKATIPRSRWVMILISSLLLALGWTDETTWDRVFVARLVAAPERAHAFMGAVVAGDVATVRAFHAHGVALNDCFLGWTALNAAASEGQLSMVRYLLDQGANVNAVDTGSSTPVDDAEQQHHGDIVALLRARGGKAYNELPPEARQIPCHVD